MTVLTDMFPDAFKRRERIRPNNRKPNCSKRARRTLNRGNAVRTTVRRVTECPAEWRRFRVTCTYPKQFADQLGVEPQLVFETAAQTATSARRQLIRWVYAEAYAADVFPHDFGVFPRGEGLSIEVKELSYRESLTPIL